MAQLPRGIAWQGGAIEGSGAIYLNSCCYLWALCQTHLCALPLTILNCIWWLSEILCLVCRCIAHKRCLGLAALANAKHPKHLPGNSGGSCQPPQRPHTECPHPRTNYCNKYYQNRGLFMTILVHRSLQKTRFTTNLESSSLLRGGNPVLNRHRHHIQKIRWNTILHEFHHVWHALCMF